ncbi:MAG TPA: VWA domain-containing protein [Thermoanaerobaculia bacterium]|nr:VWA domain-containing protein [Thermoanaerobaculia bacterium]HUM30969.1 VWA domain-containing protein [Thermoanaerobaculia bacterium]HXK69371.1 VWA domain-containing protein [Thermoanaerobaculia bacterium]
MIHFHNPLFFLLLLLPAAYFYLRRRRSSAYLTSTASFFSRFPSSTRSSLYPILHGGWILSMILIVIALARPQSGHSYTEYLTKGVDIVLTLDCSGSMQSEDFKPHNRLYVAKEVVSDFVRSRPNDRLGLVVFAGQAFTQCPLTLDHGILLTFLEKITTGMIEDGTAIGNAIAVAVDRLKSSDAKSRVIVLLTDGNNNKGEVDPLTAAGIAKTFGIKIYTIAVGIRGMAMMPVDDPIFGRRYVQVRVDIDEDILTRIAEQTGGRYFRATDPETLKEIYQTIGSLEKSTVKTKHYTTWNDMYLPFLIAGLAMLFLTVLLDLTVFRSLP